MALVTDALRGQLVSALPSGAHVVLGAPSADAPVTVGVFVHPLRIALSSARRNAPDRRVDDVAFRHPLDLDVDYLIAGLGDEALAELALLDATLQWAAEHPVRTHDRMSEGLSQPERWASLASGSLTVRWRVLDLTLEQAASIWTAAGMRQRAGLFLRAEVQWRSGQASSGPIIGL
ncbi:Pvc16 family protein [Pseudoxanthomonas japonensis]|nr:Pvc16 family protein [Pseudoxanthomonas japonensis]